MDNAKVEQAFHLSSSNSSLEDRVVIKTEPTDFDIPTEARELMVKFKIEPLIETEPEFIIPDVIESGITSLNYFEDQEKETHASETPDKKNFKTDIYHSQNVKNFCVVNGDLVDQKVQLGPSVLLPDDGVSLKTDPPSVIISENFENSVMVVSDPSQPGASYNDENNSAMKRHVCDRCGYCTVGLSEFKIHQRSHLREKPYKCDQCNFATTMFYSLKFHQRSHSNAKRFKCDQCKVTCTTNSLLEHHKWTHTVKKPFKCDKCDVSFATKFNLKAHQIKHSGEKPFKCDQCDFECKTSLRLNRHTWIHSQERPFKCDQCDFSSGCKIYLTAHQLTHSGKKPFKCDQCEYSCARVSNLKRHKLSLHVKEVAL